MELTAPGQNSSDNVSLDQFCKSKGIEVIDSRVARRSGSWFRFPPVEVDCSECGESPMEAYLLHSEFLDGVISGEGHNWALVCLICNNAFDGFNLGAGLLDIVEAKYFNSNAGTSNCRICIRTRFEKALDQIPLAKNNSPMPIISEEVNGVKKVPVYNLHDYFTQDFTLFIPPWQREYTWEATDTGAVGELMQDLLDFVEDPSSKEYLLGAVILCDTESKNKSYLIDGQQRTVTLTLLLMCCNQYLSENKIYTVNDYLFRAKLEQVINSNKDDYSPRVEFTQTHANKIMQQVYDWMKATSDARDKFIEEVDTYSKTQKNLLSVVDYISKALRSGSWIPAEKLIPSLTKILDSVKLIQLRLDSQREAIQVYDRINHRGMQLSDADLIKNQMFQMVDENDFDQISESWQSMVQTLREAKSTKLQDPKYMLRAHAWTLWNTKTTYDELVDKYVKEYFGEEEHDPIKFAQELEQFASTLVNFVKLDSKHGSLPHLQPAQLLGSVQHFPVLLAGAEMSSKESFLHLYRQVSARTTLYVLSKERPPEFESLIPKWATEIRKSGHSPSIAKLNEILKSENADFKPKLIENLRSEMLGWRVSKSADKKKIRVVLSYLSWWLDQMADKPYEIGDYFSTKKKPKTKGWDIEHVAATKYDNSKISDDIRDSIGNLVLLTPSDNRLAKNIGPNEKKELYTHSPLLLTKSVMGNGLTPRHNKILGSIYEKCSLSPTWNLETWGESDINARTEFYIEFLTAALTMQLEDPFNQ
jgi:uncharacterized protein with ParB-like and HNH nuclease domain